MERKQIYLSKSQIRALLALESSTGENTSELIRQAVDRFIIEHTSREKQRKADIKRVLKSVAGVWKDRKDINFETLRAESNRSFR